MRKIRLSGRGAFRRGARGGARPGIEKEIVGLGDGEQRAVEVGHFARTDLPANSMLVSGQHSGSLRSYSGRAMLRYDRLDPAWLDRTVERLRAMNYHPFAVLEVWEERAFRDHFRGQQTLSMLDGAPVALLDSNVSVRVYDLLPRSTGGAQPMIAIRHIPRSQCSEPEDQ